MFPTTPFPATMDFTNTSPYYWNPSIYSWYSNSFAATPYYPSGAQFPVFQWNDAHPIPTIPNYSYPYPTTGYHMDPYQASYNNYVNYYFPTSIPTTIPMSNPTQLHGTMPMPPPPAQIPAAPSTSAPPAPASKTAPVPVAKSMPKIKEEPISDFPRKCSNCQTTDASRWRNADSKDNILCEKCFNYRKINKKDRPTSKIFKKEIKKEMKTIKSE